MNKVMLIGRLTKDAEVKYSEGMEPVAITNFSLAVQRRTKKESEQEVDFIKCVSFGKTAELISKYCNKGKKVGVVGNLKNNLWTNEDGQKRNSMEVIIESIDFLDKKEDVNEKDI